jgi:hypothetical protein
MLGEKHLDYYTSQEGNSVYYLCLLFRTWDFSFAQLYFKRRTGKQHFTSKDVMLSLSEGMYYIDFV